MSLPSFDYAGLSFIAREFDRHHGRFPGPGTRKDHVIVILQLQRDFNEKGLPIEIINIIFQYHLNATGSVSNLLVFYRGSPAIHAKSFLYHYLNSAAEILLKQLKLEAPQGLDYPYLMVHVVTHYFNTLSVDKKIAFIRSSQITVWENRSLTEKIQLLGRARVTSLSDALRLISWKVQFALIKILEKNLLKMALVAFGSCLFLPWIVIAFCKLFGFGKAAFIPKLSLSVFIAIAYTAPILAGCLALSLITAALARVAQFSWFSQSTRDKGAWVQAVSWCYVKIQFHSLYFLLSILSGTHSEINSIRKALDACQDLTQLLSQSINEANLILSQETFVDAHRPELNQRWLQIAQ